MFAANSFYINYAGEVNFWNFSIECQTCGRVFRTQYSCNQHMDAKDHWAPVYECRTCYKNFYSINALNQHMDAKSHRAPVHECETCDRVFGSLNAANQHMRDKSHFKNYCPACDRHFTNENNLKTHLNSSVHRGLTMICPFCKHSFTSASGVTSHLENGSCQNAPSLNREKVYRIVNRNDPSGFITKKQIEWYPEDSAQYSATNHAFNGSFWQCYICHGEFFTVHGLNQHLNSPVHKQNLYQCPNKGNCGKEFVTLAALFNHLESESCRLVRFEAMNQCVNDVVQMGSFLTS